MEGHSHLFLAGSILHPMSAAFLPRDLWKDESRKLSVHFDSTSLTAPLFQIPPAAKQYQGVLGRHAWAHKDFEALFEAQGNDFQPSAALLKQLRESLVSMAAKQQMNRAFEPQQLTVAQPIRTSSITKLVMPSTANKFCQQSLQGPLVLEAPFLSCKTAEVIFAPWVSQTC